MSTTFAAVEIVSKRQQQNITAMGGVLVANKPVIGGRLADGRPSSSLFYWSHSHFTDDFEFGMHDHAGFEIITVVLDGANSHYDTATRRWADLVTDDIQIIQSGAGVSHNERITKGTHAFQIWFDPDYHAALQHPASYVDHPASEFAWQGFEGFSVKDIVGGIGPVSASTPGLTIRRVSIERDTAARVTTNPDDLTFCYVIDGSVTVGRTEADRDDLVIAAESSEITFRAGTAGANVFMVSVPRTPDYTPVRGR